MFDDDSVQEVTEQGFFSNLMSSIGGFFLGFILIFISIGILYWNEGRAVKASDGLSSAAKILVELTEQNINLVNGKLGHISGQAITNNGTSDPQFGISFPQFLKVKRTVYMYQWKENQTSRTEKSIGGNQTTVTDYTYTKEWSSQPVLSQGFKNPNPHINPAMSLNSQQFNAHDVKIGTYQISENLLSKLDHFSPINLNGVPLPLNWRLDNGFIYYGNGNLLIPEIGDYKIEYQSVQSGTLSIISGVNQGVLSDFQTNNGYNIGIIKNGVENATQMFKNEEKSESNTTWIFRLIGFLLMWFAFYLIAKPIGTILSFIPLFEDIFDFSAGVITLISSIFISSLVIAIAWFSHRPITSIIVVSIALIIVFIIKKYNIGKKYI